MKDTPSGAAPVRKKPNIALRALAFLVTLALILGAVALVAYRDKLNIDALRRYFTYRDLERSDSGQAQSFPHEGSISDGFAALGSDLLTASPAGCRLFSGSGTKYVDTQATLTSPVVSAVGESGLVYDAGGSSLFLFREREEVFSLTLEADKTFLSARVNPAGFLAVTSQATGYKGAATVYDASHRRFLELDLSSSFLMDALVTQDNAALAAVTIGQEGDGFLSRLDLYRVQSLTALPAGQEPVPDASCPLGSMVVLDLQEDSAGIWALGDTGVALVDLTGELVGLYDYGGRYLKEFSLGGDGFSAVLLGKYRAGTLSELAVIDASGDAAATLSINEQVLSLSAAGRYLAVLTADRLDIYTSDLTLYSTLEGIQGARKVLMRTDGTAILIAADTARLYVPN